MNRQHPPIQRLKTVEYPSATRKPLWVPLRRTKKLLDSHYAQGGRVVSPRDVVIYFEAELASWLPSIQRVRFQHQLHRGVKYNQVIIWTEDDIAARDFLFACAGKVVRDTGWCPVVMGKKRFDHKKPFQEVFFDATSSSEASAAIPGIGKLIKILPLSPVDQTSFLLTTSIANVVIDTASHPKHIDLDLLDQSKSTYVLISHAHSDHIGGLPIFLSAPNVVIAGTPLTLELSFLRILSESSNASAPEVFKSLEHLLLLKPNRIVHFPDGSSIEAFSNDHYPGSAGFQLTFSDGETLVYSGDLNIVSNLSVSYERDQVGLSPLERFSADTLLLESAHIGKTVTEDLRQSLSTDLRDQISRAISANQDAVILCPAHDYGVFALLNLIPHVFPGTRRLDSYVILDENVVNILHSMESRFRTHRRDELEPEVLRNFLGSSMLESFRLIEIGKKPISEHSRAARESGRTLICIIDPSSLIDTKTISSVDAQFLLEHALFIKFGSAVQKVSLDILPTDRTTSLNDSTWSLHTSEEYLKLFLESNSDKFKIIFLYHNYPKRLRRFIRGLRADIQSQVQTVSDL